MTAKQYLGQLRTLQKHIKVLKEELIRRRTSLESTAAPILSDRVQTSPGGDRFADAIAALADKDIQLEELLRVYSDLRQHIIVQICRMPNELQSSVLRLKYAEGMSLPQVADALHYSEGYIKQVHTAALLSFEARYEKDLVEIYPL